MLGQYCRIAKSIRGRAPVVPADAGGLLDARPGSQRDFPEPLVGTCHANPSAACHVPGLGVPAVGQSRMRGRQDLALFLRSLAFKDIKILLERFGGGGFVDVISVPGHSTFNSDISSWDQGGDVCIPEAGRKA